MKLIIGLGNPGKEYEKNRHNVGFMTLDFLARELGGTFKLDTKLKAMISLISKDGLKYLLIKPMTYMNLSGESLRDVINFYKINISDILVISDDIDSPVGRIRIREKGMAGGHNGLKSIILNIGTSEFKRIKIGIGRSEYIPVSDYVLGNFSNDDLALINKSIVIASDAIKDFTCDIEFQKIASKYSENI